MVAVLVRLKLTLTRNGMRRSAWRTVGLVIASVYTLGLVLLVWLGLLFLRRADAELTGAVTTLAFSVLTLGWLLLSLLVFGIDETVDPRRFALLPLPAHRLLPGLFVAGLISVPGVATVLVALAFVATWARGLLVTAAALVGAGLGVATAFLLSRAATAAFAQALASRRFRDLAAVFLALFGASLGILGNVAGRLAGTSKDLDGLRRSLATVADVAGWTPFGWAWSVPAAVGQGAWAAAGARLVLAGVLVVGLWYAWQHYLDIALTSPLEVGGGESRPVKRHGLAQRLYPATPTGAVATRSLTYWRRDPRYLSSLAGLLIAPIIVAVATANRSQGVGVGIAVFVPTLIALLLGAIAAQDLSYDGTALWTHITAGLAGSADRAGRALATATVVGPILVVVTLGVAGVSGRWDALPRTVPLTIAVALCGLGAGTYTGTVWQIPAPPPGANPFAKNSGEGGLRALVAFLVTTALTFALSLPTIAAVIGSIWVGWLEWVALVVALVTGVLAVRLGIRLGGRRLDTHWPEVLAAVTDHQ